MKPCLRWCAGLALAALCHVLFAQQQAEPSLQVEADALLYDGERGAMQYRGNVKARYLGMVLTGERMDVREREGAIQWLRISGAPARLRGDAAAASTGSSVSGGEGVAVDARAQTIRLHVKPERVFFLGEVDVRYGESKLSGERVEYYPLERRMVAGGKGRVRVETAQ